MLTVVPSRRVAARLLDARLVDGRAGSADPPDQGSGSVDLADGRSDSPNLSARAAWADDVVTLRELVERAVAGSPDPRPVLSGTARQLLAADVVDRLEPQVKSLFGPGVEGPGAARAIGSAIAELRMAGLSALDLAPVAPGRRRLQALACALDAWERRLEEGGWNDDADLHREATRRIEAGEWPADPIDRLVVRGLYDVTPLQGELLLALARQARTVRIHVPFDPHDEARSRYAFPYLHMWESITDPALDVEPVFPEPGPGPAVRIRPAVDPADEARRIADTARRWIDRGCAAEEIGIVTAGTTSTPALAREMDRRGVAWHARRATPLAETPLFGALLLPFRILEEGWRREDLMAWVTSPLTSELTAERLRPALARGPAGRARRSDWTRALRSVSDPSAAALTACLGEIDSLGRRERTAAEFWPEYDRLLARAGLGPEPDPTGWEAWLALRAELRAALEALRIWDEPPLPWRVHRRRLIAALGDRRVGIGRPGRGVSVLTPYDARDLAFRRQMVAGLTQGALVPRESARSIFGDRDRRALNEAFGEELFRLSGEDVAEGALLLSERIRSTGEEIVLSWPARDESGTPLLPAAELEEERKARGVAPFDDPPAAPDPAWRVDLGIDRIDERAAIELARSDFFARDPAERRGDGTRYDGAFPPAAAAELAREAVDGALHGWSAGRLETWRQCPHRFFQRYVLGLEPVDASPVEAEATAVGRLAHAALEALHAGGLGPGDPSRERIEAALEEAADGIDRAEKGDPAVWRIELRRVAATLERYFREVVAGEDDPFAPEAFEVAFGLRDATVDAVPIATARGEVSLRGIVDRIDRDPSSGRLRIVDYKYAKAQRHRDSVDPDACGVDRFQLWSYALGARRWAEARGHAEPPGVVGAIHCLKEPRALGPVSAPDPAEIERAIAAVVEDALDAGFDPSPSDPKVCDWCDYRRSCRIATVALGPASDEPPDGDEGER